MYTNRVVGARGYTRVWEAASLPPHVYTLLPAPSVSLVVSWRGSPICPSQPGGQVGDLLHIAAKLTNGAA